MKPIIDPIWGKLSKGEIKAILIKHLEKAKKESVEADLSELEDLCGLLGFCRAEGLDKLDEYRGIILEIVRNTGLELFGI